MFASDKFSRDVQRKVFMFIYMTLSKRVQGLRPFSILLKVVHSDKIQYVLPIDEEGP